MKKKKICRLMKIIAVSTIAALTLTACGDAGTSSNVSKDNSSKEISADSGNETSADNSTAPSKLSGTITMNGSTSMEKAIKAINGAFTAVNPDVTIELNLTGSGTGIQEATEGKTDIGNSSRALKDTEKGLDVTQIAIDGIAIIVNTANTVNDLTVEQLEKIYSGEIKNWKDVGGEDKAIVVIGREDGSGTRDGFESIVMKNSEAAYAQELESTGSVISTVGTTAGAIGYASLANVDETIKSVKVNGIEATEANIQNGTFPIQRPFICVVKEGNTNELVKSYLEFALSAAGQEQVKNAGAVPVK